MPSEIRHIVFSTAEVGSAIREYRRHIGRPLPAGTLRRLDMHPGKGGVRVSIDIAPENGGRSESCELGGAEITDALILYCGAHHIPLPSAGIKVEHAVIVGPQADADVLVVHLGASPGSRRGCYFRILATTPAPTVRPPSRMAKRRPSSIAIGTSSSTCIVTLSPGITISVPSGNLTEPVTSVVRK